MLSSIASLKEDIENIAKSIEELISSYNVPNRKLSLKEAVRLEKICVLKSELDEVLHIGLYGSKDLVLEQPVFGYQQRNQGKIEFDKEHMLLVSMRFSRLILYFLKVEELLIRFSDLRSEGRAESNSVCANMDNDVNLLIQELSKRGKLLSKVLGGKSDEIEAKVESLEQNEITIHSKAVDSIGDQSNVQVSLISKESEVELLSDVNNPKKKKKKKQSKQKLNVQNNLVLDSVELGSSEVMASVQNKGSEHSQTVDSVGGESDVQEQCVGLEESSINDLMKQEKAELLVQKPHALSINFEPNISSDQLSKEQSVELFEKAWNELTVLPQDMQLKHEEDLKSKELMARSSVIVERDEYLRLGARPKYSSVVDNVVNRQHSDQVSGVRLKSEKSSTGIQLREVNTKQYKQEKSKSLVSERSEMGSSDLIIKAKSSKKNTRQLNNSTGDVVSSQINEKLQNVDLPSKASKGDMQLSGNSKKNAQLANSGASIADSQLSDKVHNIDLPSKASKGDMQLSGNSRKNAQLANSGASIADSQLSDKVHNIDLTSRESKESIQLSEVDKQRTAQGKLATNVVSQSSDKLSYDTQGNVLKTKQSAQVELVSVDQIVISGKCLPSGYEVLNSSVRVFQDMHCNYCINMLQKIFDLEGNKIVVNSDIDLLLQNVFHGNKKTCVFLIKNSILVQFFSMFGIEFLSIFVGSKLKEGTVDKMLVDILTVIKNGVDIHYNIYKILCKFVVLKKVPCQLELAWFHDNMRILYSAVNALKDKSADEELMNFIAVSAVMSYGVLRLGKNMICNYDVQLNKYFMESCKQYCECDLGIQAYNILFAFGPLYCLETYGVALVRDLYVPQSVMMACCRQNSCNVVASVEKRDISFSVFIQEMVKSFYPLIDRNAISHYIVSIMQCYKNVVQKESCNTR
ncbi:hypothetical protein [Ehrlichia canis]|uniref:hypothetical protein n=1 Tax=Ehrlichia canis TaxID=944 RepID=UPI000C839E25|nr:hypothetical protein [Ehrlichia canis]AUO54365.1 hypothetical protein C1I72_00340 [Ehrlichia canis]UKC52991.1 hypothetical protein s20019040002_000033 [Ehrlichia canis]UKC53928.1 hypothetical protein s20026770001_000033 [Ehrlichia canis]UKC54864.1 hypothetical protein s21009500007_000033 [Ehrlichia canis]